MKLNLLRFIYRGILTGMPMITYNPITKTPIHIPFTIHPHSTYINYELNEQQKNILNDYIQSYDPYMEIIPIKILSHETKSLPYLSVNIYNCSSPIFFNDNQVITRLEVNTYVKRWDIKKNSYDYGTVILDYTSNALSMDPVHFFKEKETVFFDFSYNSIANLAKIYSYSKKDELYLKSSFVSLYHDPKNNSKLHDDLIYFSDAIYYKNGIYDKLYYDSSLVNANVHEINLIDENVFTYKNMSFNKANHIFYFQNGISFVGSMWDNVFSHP